MLEAVQTYIQKIVLFGILTTIAYQVLPGEKYEKYLKLYTGFLFIFLVFLPVLEISGIEESFRNFYETYEMNLQYDGEEQKAKEQLYQKYEETLAKQLEQVLEQQGYQVNTVQVVTDRKEDGKLEEVSVTLTEEEEDIIAIPVVEIQGNKELTEEEKQKTKEVQQLLETMYEGEGEELSITVKYVK